MQAVPYLLLILSLCGGIAQAQQYTVANVFAHNDYARDTALLTAYSLQVGYIEADVFLDAGNLMVAHHRNEIEPGRTLEALYLQPLSSLVERFNGLAYENPGRKLTLMIDLKTEGVSTLDAIVRVLEKYPVLTSSPTLQFLISGNVPDPGKWDRYPRYIRFDGRPAISYGRDQLNRVDMISTSFRDHSRWDGRGEISEADRRTIRMLMEDAHRKGKIFRFWATPDFPEAWRELMLVKMDVIVTDDVRGLAKFLSDHH